MKFNPLYTVTPEIIQAIARIEISRHDIIELPITTEMIASLRESARLLSTHHSTAIEGNLLSAVEVNEVIKGRGNFPHREKDEGEVRHYYRALEKIEQMAPLKDHIQEDDLKLLHGIAFLGKSKPTPYRDGQNVIRRGKLVVYIPPKSEDVPFLMAGLVGWIQESVQQNLPIPFIAALAHYQFATIHPYYDGNGRTARLLATLILHKYGYDLKGIYCLEEYYAKDLQGYYQALTVGENEDYYEGERATADLTEWLEYFIKGMADSFDRVCRQAKIAQTSDAADQSSQLRNLNPRQRQSLQLFLTSREITSKDIAHLFNCSERQARYLCHKWVHDGFLEIADAALKSRRYRLRKDYEELVQKRALKN